MEATKKIPPWPRHVFMCSLGASVGSFVSGMVREDWRALSFAFIFLVMAWIYREMNSGWSTETGKWKFLPWRKS